MGAALRSVPQLYLVHRIPGDSADDKLVRAGNAEVQTLVVDDNVVADSGHAPAGNAVVIAVNAVSLADPVGIIRALHRNKPDSAENYPVAYHNADVVHAGKPLRHRKILSGESAPVPVVAKFHAAKQSSLAGDSLPDLHGHVKASAYV